MDQLSLSKWGQFTRVFPHDSLLINYGSVDRAVQPGIAGELRGGVPPAESTTSVVDYLGCIRAAACGLRLYYKFSTHNREIDHSSIEFIAFHQQALSHPHNCRSGRVHDW